MDAPDPKDAATSQPVHILVADGRDGALRILDRMLGDQRAFPRAVTQVKSLRDAIRLSRVHRFDVVMLDLALPDGQGIDALRRCQEEAPDLPIIALPRGQDENAALTAIRYGAQDAWMMDKLQPDAAVRALRFAIERKRIELQSRALLQAHEGRKKAEEAERRASFLSQVSHALAASLDYRTTLNTVARLAVEELCDVCWIDVVEPDRGVDRVAVAYADPELAEVMQTLRRPPAAGQAAADPLNAALAHGSTWEVTISDSLIGAFAFSESQRRSWDRLVGARMVAVPFRHDSTPGIIAVIRRDGHRAFETDFRSLLFDLAARVGIAVENCRLYREAREAIEAREEILGVVSHDLRNPLHALRMAVASLQMRREHSSVTRLVSVMDRSIGNMDRLISDLLDVSRLRAGKLTLTPGRCPAGELVEEVVELLRPLASERSIQIHIAGPAGGHPPHVMADRRRVIQVLCNLLANAIKFSPTDGAIAVELYETESECCVAISDQGPGIPEADRPHIFDKYWRTQGERGGEGLGLAIAKWLIEAQAGHIGVDLIPGGGSRFWFTLPLA